MATASTTALVDALRRYRLLESASLEEVTSLRGRLSDPKALAGELIRRGWLTAYQGNQLLQGRGQELLLGSYVLLERLGEGGMGTVFKARNWKLGRVVAVKLIRKERLSHPDAIRRFRREVRAAAALSHPNIVHAYDADEIAGTLLLVMECVEGATDLARLVRENGPLPVREACDYVRQAALGLQHACDRGVVHRDIKPHNLLLTKAHGVPAVGLVKILDMGLARLDQPAGDDNSSTMTQEGTFMGTADYIAPEQAMQSHTVDTRADLYSLGCTFYYLLTGKVPFPGGTLLDKVLRHRLEEPRPVEQLRPDVPPDVAAVVRKLMAKRPEDRFQAPAEVAAALAAIAATGETALATSLAERTGAESQRAAVPAEASGDTPASPFANLGAENTEALDSPQHSRRSEGQRLWLLFGAAGGCAVLAGLLVVLYFVFRMPAENPQERTEDRPGGAGAPSAQAPRKADDAWLKEVAALPAEKQVPAVAAKLKELNQGFDSQVTHKIADGVVTELAVPTDNVTDISPVRALAGLRTLACSGTAKGRLTDLSPLKGMPLLVLSCHDTKVSDLAPLKGMPLTHLVCDFRPERDAEMLRSLKTLETINGKPTREFWKEVDQKKP